MIENLSKTRRNVALARDIMESFSRSDFEFLYRHTIRGPEIRVVGLTDEKLGSHKDNENLVPDTFPNGMQFTIHMVVAEGQNVCVQWDDIALASSGKTYENSGLSVFKFTEDGKVAGYIEYIDADKFLEVI